MEYLYPSVSAQTTTFEVADATGIITDAIGDFSSVLTSGLPVVLGVLGVLIGLFFLWRQIQKRIGSPK